MARSEPVVLLGYDDELITDKHKGQINFTTNKIGGKPDLPSEGKLDLPSCPLCQLPRPLIVQIYAPLENSTYHRTLYIFACINPNCWNQSESWICLKIQTLQKLIEDSSVVVQRNSTVSATDWCADADDWGDGNANFGEENGNVINVEKNSDEDEESCSLEDAIRVGFENFNFDDTNANPGAEIQGMGATGRLHSPAATAEIEGDEGEIVTIDTPTYPQNDIPSLLHEAAPLPQELCQNARNSLESRQLLQFIPYFITVWEETPINHPIDDHVRELLQEYQHKTEENIAKAAAAAAIDESDEKYEKSHPAHGDKMFHSFLTKIQQNPGQILRYSREGSPLLMQPLHQDNIPHKCLYCQGDMVFELQILSTLIPKLRLIAVDGNNREGARLEYGNVLIYTCRQSCWGSNGVVQQEAVVVQAEIY